MGNKVVFSRRKGREEEELSVAKRFSSSSSGCLYPGRTAGKPSDSIELEGRLDSLARDEGGRGIEREEEARKTKGSILVKREPTTLGTKEEGS